MDRYGDRSHKLYNKFLRQTSTAYNGLTSPQNYSFLDTASSHSPILQAKATIRSSLLLVLSWKRPCRMKQLVHLVNNRTHETNIFLGNHANCSAKGRGILCAFRTGCTGQLLRGQTLNKHELNYPMCVKYGAIPKHHPMYDGVLRLLAPYRNFNTTPQNAPDKIRCAKQSVRQNFWKRKAKTTAQQYLYNCNQTRL